MLVLTRKSQESVVVGGSVGILPTWGHSRNWGYGPSGGLGLVLVILLMPVLIGRI